MTARRGSTVRVNGIEMYFEEYGEGKPVVLLHGFGGCGQTWLPFTDALSKRHRLIVVDLRGHGYSTNPKNEFTHREAATDVFHLLDELEIVRFSAMGISSGGMVLLHMATSQPSRIESMVLVSATSHFPAQARSIMRETSFARIPRQVQQMYRECAKRGDAQIHQLIAQFNAFHDNYNDMNFTERELSTITTRTLIVHGDRDRFFPIEIPVSIHKAIPNSALWIIAGGDHVPIYDPTVPFVSKALEFLDGTRTP
ncbi:MAG: alpha/beta hydrolase [Polyangiaceae bacterium]